MFISELQIGCLRRIWVRAVTHWEAHFFAVPFHCWNHNRYSILSAGNTQVQLLTFLSFFFPLIHRRFRVWSRQATDPGIYFAWPYFGKTDILSILAFAALLWTGNR